MSANVKPTLCKLNNVEITLKTKINRFSTKVQHNFFATTSCAFSEICFTLRLSNKLNG